MLGVITLIVIVALVALAAFALVGTVRGRPPGRADVLATRVATGVLAVQAVVAAVWALSGVAVPEMSTFLIYLVVTVCVLPIALQFATAEPTRWGGAVIAVGAIGVAVAVWRCQLLWDAAGV